eukprot:scaffold67728_cov28-Tisochrysis_lutea.AAC.1
MKKAAIAAYASRAAECRGRTHQGSVQEVGSWAAFRRCGRTGMAHTRQRQERRLIPVRIMAQWATASTASSCCSRDGPPIYCRKVKPGDKIIRFGKVLAVFRVRSTEASYDVTLVDGGDRGHGDIRRPVQL